jgi:hypothetical protein
MKLPLYTNNKKDERSRGGRAEGHLAKPTALKTSRHGVALVTSDAQAHQFFCVGEFFEKNSLLLFLWPSKTRLHR